MSYVPRRAYSSAYSPASGGSSSTRYLPAVRQARTARRVAIIQAKPAYMSPQRMVVRKERRVNMVNAVSSALKKLGIDGNSIGKFAGPQLSHVTGLGDYRVKYNSIMNPETGAKAGDYVPVVSNSGYNRSVRLRHREFIQDVDSTTVFQNLQYQINPANTNVFPWLSNIARNFQEYRMHGLVFTYVSTSANALNSTNTALGTVIMSTDYNAGNTPFVNKSQAENSEYTISCKPSESMQHGIECDPSITVNQGHLYISPFTDGTVPSNQDIKTYNLGNFQFMTVGSQAIATIGELHVSYDIELIKPIDVSLTSPGVADHWWGDLPTASSMLASPSVGPHPYTDSLGSTIPPDGSGNFNVLQLPTSTLQGQIFMVFYTVTGIDFATPFIVSPTLTGLTALTTWQENIQSQALTAATAVYSGQFCIIVKATSATGPYSIDFSSGSPNIPSTNNSCDLVVVKMPANYE